MLLALSVTSCNPSKPVESKYYQSSKVTSSLSIKDAVQSYVNKVDVNYGYNLAYKLAYDTNYSQHLGWRLAGSEAEHATAFMLKDEMRNIGIKEENIKMEKLPCDSFDFINSSLTMPGHDEIHFSPACYQLNGTYKDGHIETYTYPLIDIGTGTEEEFNKIIDDTTKSNGYIALIGINQDDDWIDTFVKESYIHGAKALVTYSIGGYGMENEDAIAVTDVCAGGSETIPTCAISLKQANQLKDIIKDSKTTNCNLNLNCTIKEYDDKKSIDENPCTYDVYGVIPGKDRSKQIVLGAHYDKYWYGFQDDSCAIGLIFTVAKSLIDSNYIPEHDIVICCTGAEEWGKTDSPGDWTTGAWELLEKDNTWADKTIALINCELPANRPDAKHENSILSIGSVPEYKKLVSTFINDTGLIVTSGDIKLDRTGFDSAVNEDGIAYRYHGCPYFINYFSDDEFQSHKYHTSLDNKDTYDKDTFLTNINIYGALAIYLDNLATVPLDFTISSINLNDSLNESVNKDAGISNDLISKYKDYLDNFSIKAIELNNQTTALNNSMWEARRNNNTEQINKLKINGEVLSTKQRKIFKSLQDNLLKVNDFDCYYGHREFNNSYIALKNALDDINYNNKPLFLNDVRSMNTLHCSKYVDFNVEVGNYYINKYTNLGSDTLFKKQWMFNKLETNIECISNNLGKSINDVALKGADLSTAKTSFENAYAQAKKDLLTILTKEVKDIETIISYF